MKLHAPLLLAVALCSAAACVSAADAWKPLFNGRDLTGWEKYLGTPFATSTVPGAERDAKGNYTKPLGLNNDPLNCFTVVEVDGRPAIRVSGEGWGTLTTLEGFSNYHLRAQFKWGQKKWMPGSDKRPRASGILYHAWGNHGDADTGKRWLHSHQFQLQEGTCGEYVVVGNVALTATARSVDGKKYIYDPASAPVLFSPKQAGRCTNCAVFENVGWNTLEIICVGDTVVHLMNGHEVFRGTKSGKVAGESVEPLTGGRLQLQMEGSEIFFRDIEIQPASVGCPLADAAPAPKAP